MIRVEKKTLLKGMSIGASFAGKSSTLPILSCVKVSIKGNHMIFSSYDGECAITNRVSIDGEYDENTFCVNASDFLKAIKSINDEEISLSAKDSMLTISYGRGQMVLPTENVDDFPKIEKSGNTAFYEISSEKLFGWIEQAKDFVGNDDLRPAMKCMYLYVDGNEVGFCASDGQKLITDSYIDENMKENVSVLVPSSSFSALMSLINGTEHTSVYVDERSVSFSVGYAKMHCVLCQQKFPNFKSVIPSGNTIFMEAVKKELQESVNRASLFTDKSSSLLVIDLIGEKANLVAEDIDFSKKSKEECSVSHDGDDIKIGVKSTYMSNCLSAIQSDTVRIEMTSPQRAMIFKDYSNERKTILLMPCLIG